MRLFKYTLTQMGSSAPFLQMVKRAAKKKRKPAKKARKRKRRPRVFLKHEFEDPILQVLYDSRAAELQSAPSC